MFGRGHHNAGRGYGRGRGYNSGRGNGRGYNNGRKSSPYKTYSKKYVKDEIIPFNPKTTTTPREHAKLERRVGNTTRKKRVPMFQDPTDIEQLCLTISDFDKAALAGALNINTEDLCFEYFPQVLSAPMDSQWESLASVVATPYAVGDFEQCQLQFIGLYVGADGVDKQCNYLRNLKSKPHDMKCAIAWLRIHSMNNYMANWPNSPNPGHPPLSEHDMKIIFEGLMLSDWVNDAAKAGIRASDATIDVNEMVSFYQTCMDQHNEKQSRRDQQDSRSNSGGRGGRGYNRDSRRYSPYSRGGFSSGYNQQAPVPYNSYQAGNYPARNTQGQYVSRGGGRGFPNRGGFQGRFSQQAGRAPGRGGRTNYDGYHADPYELPPQVPPVASMPSMTPTEGSDQYHATDMFSDTYEPHDQYHSEDPNSYQNEFIPPDYNNYGDY